MRGGVLGAWQYLELRFLFKNTYDGPDKPDGPDMADGRRGTDGSDGPDGVDGADRRGGTIPLAFYTTVFRGRHDICTGAW